MQNTPTQIQIKDLIVNFITALRDEIEAIKSGKGGSVVKVSNGKFIRQESKLFIYSFTLESFLYTIDDAPIELRVDGSSHKGQIIQIQDQEVILGIEVNLGGSISEAKIINDLSFLLEKLQDKLKASLETKAYNDFNLANFVFKGEASRIPSKSPALSFEESNKKNNLNESQLEAVKATQVLPLTYVWGPPGTGKTHTLARITESFIKKGYKVLLVSHSNTAVDGAIKGVAEVLLKTNYYNDGKIIRLGSTPDESLASNYELVLLDNIAAKFGKALNEEKKDLEKQQENIETRLSKVGIILDKVQSKNNIQQNIDQAKKKFKEISFSINYADRENKILGIKQDSLFEKLNKAKTSNSIIKFVLGLDVEKIQKEIDSIQIQISNKEAFLSKKKIEQTEFKNQFNDYNQIMSELDNEITSLLHTQNINSSDFFKTVEELKGQKDKINIRISEIEKELDTLKIKALNEARVVGTTLTKTFLSKELEDISFDALIVDEASMALMPQIYWALSKCKKSAVIVGDFLQLPPICMSETKIAKECLGKNIYQYMNIDLSNVDENKTVKLLDTQYRMHPKISTVSKEIFYKNKLSDGKDTKLKINKAENISKQALTLIDTSNLSPWCSRLSTGGRFNIYNAILSAKIAEMIAKKYKYRVGIISPYNAQVKLIRKVLDDLNVSDIQVSTVHKFQGSEKDIIIFDTVEGPGADITGMIDDRKLNSDAKLLLNVAFTRAESQFILIGNINHLEKYLSEKTVMHQIINKFKENGEIIDCQNIVDSFLISERFEMWAEKFLKLNPSAFSEFSNSSIHSEKSFYAALFLDLKNAKEEVIIFSPFLSIRKSTQLIEIFRCLVNKGVKLKLYTKPISQQGVTLSQDAEKVIEQLEKIGIKVIQRSKMHQKVVIIDKATAWTGSLNILSHKDTGEQMVRINYPKTINELINNLELDDNSLKRQNQEIETYETCPNCNEQFLLKGGKFGPYLLCRNCSNKEKLKNKMRTKIPCPNSDCDGKMVIRYSKKGWFLGCSCYPDCKETQSL